MPFSSLLKKPWITSFVAFCILILCLLPILRSGLYSDDLHNFQRRNSLPHLSTGEIVHQANLNIGGWKGSGRFTPVALYLEEFVFSTFEDVAGYKLYMVAANLLAVMAFAFLLYSLGQTGIIPLVIFFYLGEIQFRIQTHDAFTSFHGMYQWICICLFTTGAFYALYLRSGGALYYVLALILASITILVSEEGVLLLPLICLIGWARAPSNKKALVQIAPFLLITIIYMAYLVYLHRNQNWQYSGVETNFETEAMFRVINAQLFSSVPFSNLYHQAAIPLIFAHQFREHFNYLLLTCIVAGILLFLILFLKFRNSDNSGLSATLVLLSVMLLLVPALILSPSVKYQSQLSLSTGYLPLYIQNFGMALLLAVFAGFCLKRRNGVGLYCFLLLSVANLLGASSELLFNSALMDVKHYNTFYPAQAMNNSVKNGILSVCPEGSTILLAQDFYVQAPQFYHDIFKNRTGKDMKVFDQGDWKPVLSDSSSQNCFLLDCIKGDTIYTKLFSIDCTNGQKEVLIKCDTTLHLLRLSPEEEPILTVRN